MKGRLLLAAVLLFTSLSFLLSPAYMIFLRQRFERHLPEEWAKVTNNGPFHYVSPLIVQTRNAEEGLYAIKVRQILMHGFPYDPHTGDRSVKSWMFDCMMFYPLAPFIILAGGSLQAGWVLAHAILGALWVFFLYLFFSHYTKDPAPSIALAVACFFFIDCSVGFFTLLLPTWSLSGLSYRLSLLAAYACGPVQWMRLPTPGMTFFWLYGSLWWCYLLALAPARKPLSSLAAGLSIGLLCLAHFYEWVFGVSSLFFFFLAGTLWGLPRHSRWNLGLSSGISLFVSGAYYLYSRHLTQEVMNDIISRMGAFDSGFYGPSLIWAGLAVFFGLRSSEQNQENRWLWIFGAVQQLSLFFLFNLQVILGYDIQFGHLGRMAAFTATLWLSCWLLENQKLRDWLRPRAPVLAAAVLAWVFLREKSWAEKYYKVFGAPRDVEAAVQWVQKNAPKESTLISLSGTLTEYLPLQTQLRYPVSNGSPAYGSPVSTEASLRGLAKILKTARADPELFMERRWRHFSANDAQKHKLAYFTRNLPWEEAEKTAWPYFLLNIQAFREKDLEEKGTEILEYFKRSAPLEPPFYFWLHQGDEVFLRRRPETQGWTLIYQNPSVRLYHAPAKTQSSQ